MEADSQISALIANASDGTLTESEVRDETTTLLEKGFGSLSFLKLIDSIELSYGVYIDLEEDTAFLGRVSGIRSFLIAEGVLELA
jgi:acyl carrier protein